MRSTICRVLCLMILSLGALCADDKDGIFEGWGELFDPSAYSKVELVKDVLVMTAPDDYVDNHNKTNAPRVINNVSGDFTAEVTVLHVDPSKPNTVLARLGNFPVACHSGTLLVRGDQENFVRLEHMNSCRQEPSSKCYLHVYQDGKRIYHNVFEIKDVLTRLKLVRHGNSLIGSFSQDDGKTWKTFEQADIEFLSKKVEVGVSMTSNTDPGCTVKFRDFKIATTDK